MDKRSRFEIEIELSTQIIRIACQAGTTELHLQAAGYSALTRGARGISNSITSCTRWVGGGWYHSLATPTVAGGTMHICVVGTGYVGLVTGACLADFGMTSPAWTRTHQDRHAPRRARSRSTSPVWNAGRKERQAGRLHFTTDLDTAIQKALAIFIAVGTPPKEDGSADLSYVIQVAEAIADNMNGYKVVVTKSTVPIGTGAADREASSRERTTAATRSRSCPTPSSCARAPRSRTSCAPTGW